MVGQSAETLRLGCRVIPQNGFEARLLPHAGAAPSSESSPTRKILHGNPRSRSRQSLLIASGSGGCSPSESHPGADGQKAAVTVGFGFSRVIKG